LNLIIYGKKPSDIAIEPKIISIPNKQIFKFGFSDTKKPQLIVSIPLKKVISAKIFNISLSIYYSSSFINPNNLCCSAWVTVQPLFTVIRMTCRSSSGHIKNQFDVPNLGMRQRV
jgi:hypothetical protein